MELHGIYMVYTMELHGIPLYYVVLWYAVTLHGELWLTMLFHILCMVIVWYTMASPVSKHHGVPWFPWYIMTFYHGLPE